jgi:hypothetical protein
VPDATGDATELVQPGSRARTRARWELRALQWRAAELAEAIFGDRVSARRLGGGSLGFRGLIELDVPFRDIERHRRDEARFVAAAARDELLGSAALVYVFTPRVEVP